MVQVTPISYLNERKMQLGVENGHQILFTAEEGCMFMTLNRVYTSLQVIQASIDAIFHSESSIFLQWVWLASNSTGALPTRHPCLKVFGVARLAGLLSSLVSQTHFHKRRERSGELGIQAVSCCTVQCGTITLQYFVT